MEGLPASCMLASIMNRRLCVLAASASTPKLFDTLLKPAGVSRTAFLGPRDNGSEFGPTSQKSVAESVAESSLRNPWHECAPPGANNS